MHVLQTAEIYELCMLVAAHYTMVAISQQVQLNSLSNNVYMFYSQLQSFRQEFKNTLATDTCTYLFMKLCQKTCRVFTRWPKSHLLL